jgi:hemin uptake protein HemP
VPDNRRAAARLGSATPGTRKTLQLAELLGDAQGIDIDHKGHVYRLQITKAGKLILTK